MRMRIGWRLWLSIAGINHYQFYIIKQTVIIGGGLSGLSTAYFLKKKGVPFILLEKESRFGGVMEKFCHDEAVFDKAAVSFSMTPEILEICKELGIENELVYAMQSSAARYIFRRKKLRKLTASPASIFKSPLLSWKAKFRLLKESRIKTKSPKGESVADFVSRRLGREMYESVANAVLSGIYAGNPERMEAAVVLKQFVEYEKEFGSVIKGMKANKGKNKRVISSFKMGTGFLTDSLYEYVKESCISGKASVGLDKTDSGYSVKCQDGSSFEAENIISCLPSFEIGRLLNSLTPELSASLCAIPYSRMKLSHLVYKMVDIKRPIDGFGFLIPEVEKKPLLGAVINSNVFENRAKPDETSFTVFTKTDLGHTPEKAKVELEQILEIKGQPVYSEITTWPKAIPQFEIGHSEILQRIDEFERNEKIIISGNFRSGVSVGDCVKFAKKISH